MKCMYRCRSLSDKLQVEQKCDFKRVNLSTINLKLSLLFAFSTLSSTGDKGQHFLKASQNAN